MISTLPVLHLEHDPVLRAVAEKLEVQARVLDSMAEGVVLTDDGGIISYTNPAFEKMFGYEPGGTEWPACLHSQRGIAA